MSFSENLASTLPPLYAPWIQELLDGPLPPERKATCERCVMCSPSSDQAPDGALAFNPQSKCCTYLPVLHNFLVGRILLDDDPALAPGRATVEARIQKGVAVSPLGLLRAGLYTFLYEHSPDAFGLSQALRCPHYLEERGQCGMWRHREATCATWFCKHERGAVGMRFWKTLKQLLSAVESSLARWCVLELDVGTEALRRLFPPPQRATAQTFDEHDLDGRVDLKEYRALWGTWAGREREFYRSSAALVNPLTWQEVRALCGPEVGVYVRLTQEAYRALHSQMIPPALRVRRFEVVDSRPEASTLASYSRFDPLKVPRPLLRVLPYFDGRPTDEAVQCIAAEQGIQLDPPLMRKLVDFEILSAPEGE